MWQVWTFPPAISKIGQGETLLIHPHGTGNYIVGEESENVPTQWREDSDECDDRTDDHRNVWIIRERHAGKLCVAQGGNLISILVSFPLLEVMDLRPGPRLSFESMDSRKRRKAMGTKSIQAKHTVDPNGIKCLLID